MVMKKIFVDIIHELSKPLKLHMIIINIIATTTTIKTIVIIIMIIIIIIIITTTIIIINIISITSTVTSYRSSTLNSAYIITTFLLRSFSISLPLLCNLQWLNTRHHRFQWDEIEQILWKYDNDDDQIICRIESY